MDENIADFLVNLDHNPAVTFSGCRGTMMIERGSMGRSPAQSLDEPQRETRIEELERKVASLTRALGNFAIGPLAGARANDPAMIGIPATPFAFEPGQAAATCNMTRPRSTEERAWRVRGYIRRRRERAELFPSDFFSDPVWDMMLDLYAAHLERQPVSVSSLCIAAAVPATTALRWIKTLTARGWFERARDERDGRRVYVSLSDDALSRLDRYFDSIEN
ncbi:winged helix DNA-binding protein [Sphingopyxis chilensis]